MPPNASNAPLSDYRDLPHPNSAEKTRLEALRSYGILDTGEEDDYDRLVALAAEVCQTPISLVSFIDEKRQWIKARVGTELRETCRSIAFCSVAIQGRDTLVVEDASLDPRFADNPLVTGEPGISFYAGAPVLSDEGYPLGTLCVIDTVPRRLGPQQLKTLETLSRSVATLLETSKTRKLRAALQESQRCLSISLACANQIWWDWRIDAKQMSIHGTDRCILGYDCLEASTDESFWWGLMHPEDRPRVEASLAEHFSGESKTWQAENRFRDRAGVYRWVLQSGTVTDWDEDGAPRRMLGITQLHDERKRIELELERAKILYQSVVNDQTELICRFDHAFFITFLNAAYKQRLSKSEIESGHPASWLDAFPEEQRSEIAETVVALKEDETTRIEPLPFSAGPNSGRWVQWTVRHLRTAKDDGERFQAVGVDVTQAIEAERRLQDLLAEAQDARRTAENALRAKSDFLAAMSHELRTPLNPIIAGADLLRDEVAGSENEELAEMISTAGHHLLGLIGQVLDLSKLEAGKVEPVFEFDDVTSTLRSVCHMHLAQCKQLGLTFQCAIAEDIPDQLRLDASILRQILINFLSNAIKFTPKGGILLKAAYAAGPNGEDGALSVTVKDSGIGIAPEVRERIFQPFEQADSGTSRKYGGTGIGLSICKRLVDLLGGSISIRSEIGHGTEITVTLPAARAKPIAKPVSSATPAADGKSPAFRGRILVVEDDKANQLLIKRLLDSKGYVSECANDAPQALERIEADPPKLVLMDLHLPCMDGFEAIARIREKLGDRSPEIIAMSADVRPEVLEKLATVGVCTLLTKPFQSDTLFKALAKLNRLPA